MGLTILSHRHRKSYFCRLHQFFWRMLETKCVDYSFGMLVTALKNRQYNKNSRQQYDFVTNILNLTQSKSHQNNIVTNTTIAVYKYFNSSTSQLNIRNNGFQRDFMVFNDSNIGCSLYTWWSAYKRYCC